jgi:metal-sulfur cluster biosynthetic enzyme
MSTLVSIASSRLPAGTAEEVVWHLLGRVIDPELGVPITELGLVYDVAVSDTSVSVEMTTTTPICPLGEFIRREIQRHLAAVAGVDEIDVTITHDPPWTPEMMTDEARRQLGWP